MRAFLRVAAFMLMTGGAFEALGLLSHELDRTLSLLGLGLLLASFAPDFAATSRPGRRAAIAGVFCLVVAAPIAAFAPLGIAAFDLFVLAGTALLSANAPRTVRVKLQSFVWAFCIVVLLAELGRLFPLVWHLKRITAHELSHASELLPRPASFAEILEPWKWIREPRNLGPTAMALPLLAACVALILGRRIAGADLGRRRIAVATLSLLATHGVFLLLLTPTASWLALHHRTWSGLLMNPQWLFLVIGAGVVSCLGVLTVREREGPGPPASTIAAAAVSEPAARRLDRSRTVSGFCLGMMLVLAVGRVTPPPQGSVKVMLYDAGYTNWNVPQHGRYGENSAGMFGVLPELLQAAGHRVERGADLRRLEGPDPPDCLVLINIQTYLERADRERVLQFVRHGGGLLCLGDHTGVAGIRGPFNELLAPTGLRLAFDSATFFAGGWSNALERRGHPVNAGVQNDEDYQIWVGASVDLGPGAAPVIVARYGWSDLGDMANIQRAYLGDRRYNPDELLGDVVLAAEARVGLGKVLLFGDTSTYQNLSLSRSWEFVLRSIQHLGHRGGAPASVRVQIAALLIFALLFGLVTYRGKVEVPLASACAGSLIASAAWAAFVRPPAVPALDWSQVTPPSLVAAMTPMQGTAVVDRSHGGRFDLRAWNDASIGGLTLNLMRDGFFPIVSETFPWRQLERAAVVVLVAPQRAYSVAERRALRRFVDDGGRLLVCVGHEELDGAPDLLRDYGFAVRDLPLAHFSTGSQQRDLSFLEAWAVDYPSTAEVLVRQWGQPVVARLQVGRGQVVLIGDTRYLSNRNLEGREKWYPGNIAFLSALDRGQPIVPIDSRFGEPREQGALADSPAERTPAPAPGDTTAVPGRSAHD